MSAYSRYETEKRKLVNLLMSGQITPEQYDELIKKLAKKCRF